MKRHTSPRSTQPSPTNLTRRHFLQGLGICVALPAFESLVSSPLRAAEAITGIATNSSSRSAGHNRHRRTLADGLRLFPQWRTPGLLVAQGN